jgi:hypothetical protein
MNMNNKTKQDQPPFEEPANVYSMDGTSRNSARKVRSTETHHTEFFPMFPHLLLVKFDICSVRNPPSVCVCSSVSSSLGLLFRWWDVHFLDSSRRAIQR